MLIAGEQGILIGDHVHIAAGCYLFGSGGRIRMDDFSGLPHAFPYSHRVRITCSAT
ncbi:MAG: hypothetical protein JO053_12885 [Acidobacteria bacterium]|nr:hypothetical protein [Acidobacteriota bacterium]